MFLIYPLIFLSFLSEAAQYQCHNITLYGSIIEKDKKIYLVTHQNSQEEKLWPVQVGNYKQRLQLYSLENVFVKAQGLLIDRKDPLKTIAIQNIERSITASQISRNANAIMLGSKTDCPK